MYATMNLTTALLAALLVIFPRSPAITCLRTRAEVIASQARDAAYTRHVPPGLLLAIGFMESHLGCDRASGGCWGAPIDPQHRGTAGTPDHAAQALATSFRVCGSWEGAVCRFRCGLCRCPDRHTRYASTAMGLARRIYTTAGEPVPVALTPRVASRVAARR